MFGCIIEFTNCDIVCVSYRNGRTHVRRDKEKIYFALHDCRTTAYLNERDKTIYSVLTIVALSAHVSKRSIQLSDILNADQPKKPCASLTYKSLSVGGKKRSGNNVHSSL